MSEIERIRQLGSDLPEVRDEVHDAARAALMERFEPRPAEPARPLRRRRRALSLAGALAAAAAIFLLALLSGRAPTGEPQEALAAELQRLARISPDLSIIGPGWNLIGIEATSSVEGRTAFFYGDPPADPDHFNPKRFSEFRWRSISSGARIQQLRGSGFTTIGQALVNLNTPGSIHLTEIQVPVFSRDRGTGPRPLVAVWEREGRAYEFRGVSPRRDFERALERLQSIDAGEFISAARPGIFTKPIEPLIELPNGEKTREKGGLVGEPPAHPPDTPAQERALFRQLFANDAEGEAPIVQREGERTWMVVRRFAALRRLLLRPPGD